MDLWIRSQDKDSLIKVYDIWIDDTDMLDEGYVSIMANSKFSFDLGHYKTKERALEVLDEILKELRGINILEYLNKHNVNMDNVFPILTYEMPKE